MRKENKRREHMKRYKQHGSVKFTRINAKLLFSNANNCQQKKQSVITLPGSVDFLRWPSLHLTLVSVGFAACTSTVACSFSTRSAELATNISQLLYHLATTSTNYCQSPASFHCPLLLHIMYSMVGGVAQSCVLYGWGCDSAVECWSSSTYLLCQLS